MSPQPPPRTCGVCINPIRGPVYFEPIGRNDGLVPVGSCCYTAPRKRRADDGPSEAKQIYHREYWLKKRKPHLAAKQRTRA